MMFAIIKDEQTTFHRLQLRRPQPARNLIKITSYKTGRRIHNNVYIKQTTIEMGQPLLFTFNLFARECLHPKTKERQLSNSSTVVSSSSYFEVIRPFYSVSPGLCIKAAQIKFIISNVSVPFEHVGTFQAYQYLSNMSVPFEHVSVSTFQTCQYGK